MTVSCSACNQSWPRDPALEVVCPKCEAKIGTYCRVRRPSGHTCNFGNKTLIHPARDQLAMDFGFLQRCPAAIIPATTAYQAINQQMSLL